MSQLRGDRSRLRRQPVQEHAPAALVAGDQAP
jgi:hypothetical protein